MLNDKEILKIIKSSPLHLLFSKYELIAIAIQISNMLRDYDLSQIPYILNTKEEDPCQYT